MPIKFSKLPIQYPSHFLACTPTRSNVFRTLAVLEMTMQVVISCGVEKVGSFKKLNEYIITNDINSSVENGKYKIYTLPN